MKVYGEFYILTYLTGKLSIIHKSKNKRIMIMYEKKSDVNLLQIYTTSFTNAVDLPLRPKDWL